LTGLPPHNSIDINFLLAIIDSWDGTEPGEGPGACIDCHPDFFTVTVDGNPIFFEAFGFNGPIFNPPPGVLLDGGFQLGFNPDDDFAFDMGLNPAFHNIPHSAKSLTIEWVASGDGWQGGNDESWAIDNVEVVLIDSEVHIEVTLPGTPFGVGTFAATGPAAGGVVICDEGLTEDLLFDVKSVEGGQGIKVRLDREFTCDDGSGTFIMRVKARILFDPREVSGRWKILSGTGDYENLRGSGVLTDSVLVNPDPLSVIDILDGRIHNH
jgi:hypothetical protein